ncbi:MAG: 5-formyltetrahydrofolate cyclo-ligase [Paracoccaceae bacterium]
MRVSGAKAALRAQALARRRLAHRPSDNLTGPLAAWLSGRSGRLALYWPIRSEIDPRPLAASWKGPVCLPVIAGPGRALDFRDWPPGGAVVAGPFGAMVPPDGPAVTPDILVVPLVAFDDAGGRLGYGGGFYDRTLERLRAQAPVVTVGFAYAAQRVESVPQEATDQPLDAVATELGVIEVAS